MGKQPFTRKGSLDREGTTGIINTVKNLLKANLF